MLEHKLLSTRTYGEIELSEIILILILAGDSRRIVISRLAITLRARGRSPLESTPATTQRIQKTSPDRKIRARPIALLLVLRVCTSLARCIYLSHYQIHARGTESRGWMVVRETTLRIPYGMEEEHWTEC